MRIVNSVICAAAAMAFADIAHRFFSQQITIVDYYAVGIVAFCGALAATFMSLHQMWK